MDRTWIMSAFVDLRGFGTWIYRASIPSEVKEPFIAEYLDIVQKYISSRSDLHAKYLGDGFLVIKEFTTAERKNGAVFDFVKGLRSVTRKIMKLMKDCSQPPGGVRVRITDGYSYKVMVVNPYDPMRKGKVPEFIEYGINTAERLLEVNPEIICLVSDGVARKLMPHRKDFQMRKLGTPSCYPKGVNREDLETLEVLRF